MLSVIVDLQSGGILSVRGDSSIQLSRQKLIVSMLQGFQWMLLLTRYLWFNIYFHKVELLADIFASSNLFLFSYLADTNPNY